MPTTNTRRVGLATLATSLVLGGSVVGAGAASAKATFSFDRVAGADRYATSAEAAKRFGAADTVILASGEPGRYPDALTANYLAGIKNAPVMLTRKDSVSTEVKKQISDSGAKNVIIVGGTDVVSQKVQDDLDGTYNVSRIAGSDRFATAAAVINEGNEASTDTALLATGFNFPDALGGGPLSFADKMPLAITKPNDAPDDVVKALKQAGISKVLVLGGKTAVSEDVVNELQSKGIAVAQRFDGADRAETSTKLATYEVKNYGFSNTATNVASGYVKGDGADALGGAPLTGKQKRPMLITKSNTVPGDSVLKYLSDNSKTLTEALIFGGESALSKSAENQMVKAVLGSGALNERSGEFYNDAQSAVDAAQPGDTINLFGPDNKGFVVKTKGLTITGDQGTKVSSAIAVQNADDVTISGLTITPTDVGGQVAGIYLNGTKNATIKNDVVVGDKTGTGAGVINEIGGASEQASITNSTFKDLRQGVYANPTAEFKIDSNEFDNNTAGSANDTASTITNNTFVNNDEGVGLGAPGSTVTSNSFANNSSDHVGDYTTDKSYDLKKMISDNTFDEAVKVTDDDTKIVDAS